MNSPLGGSFRPIGASGKETFTCAETPPGWRLAGDVDLVLDGHALALRYDIACDREWRTRKTVVTLRTPGEPDHELELVADGAGSWFANGAPRADLAGCLDVDLSFSPITNTLPIRRLALADGASNEVRAAWVRLPALTVEVLPQAYTRLAADRYVYESRGGAFRAEITVDREGLVVLYPGGWERTA